MVFLVHDEEHFYKLFLVNFWLLDASCLLTFKYFPLIFFSFRVFFSFLWSETHFCNLHFTEQWSWNIWLALMVHTISTMKENEKKIIRHCGCEKSEPRSINCFELEFASRLRTVKLSQAWNFTKFTRKRLLTLFRAMLLARYELFSFRTKQISSRTKKMLNGIQQQVGRLVYFHPPAPLALIRAKL